MLFCSSFISTPTVARQCFQLHYYYFPPTIGGEVFKRTFMQHCNSIKINTNEMFTSMAAGARGGVAHPPSPGETLVLSASEEILLKQPSPCTINSI